MFENFPYTDMHQLNLDWIIKIAKDFLDQYTSLQQMIADGEQSLTDLTQDGLNDLQEKADTLQGLLDAWYTEHSTDIANQLADALQDLNAWYTLHQGYLDQALTDILTAFNTAADQKAAQTIASIPDDYTALSNKVESMRKGLPFPNLPYITELYITPEGVASGVTRLNNTDASLHRILFTDENNDGIKAVGYQNDNTPMVRIYETASGSQKTVGYAIVNWENLVSETLQVDLPDCAYNLDFSSAIMKEISMFADQAPFVKELYINAAGIAAGVGAINDIDYNTSNNLYRVNFANNAFSQLTARATFTLDTLNKITPIKSGNNIYGYILVDWSLITNTHTYRSVIHSSAYSLESSPYIHSYLSLNSRVLPVGENQLYKTIAAAVQDAKDLDTILIYPGTYTEAIDSVRKNLNFVGIDKYQCIWEYPNGDYNDPPLEIVWGSVQNLTIHATHTDNPTANKAYCLHCDFQSHQGIIGGYLHCYNVRFINEDYKAVGIGLRGQATIEFENCEFISNADYEAFYCHDAYDTNFDITSQRLVIRNSTFRNNSATRATIEMESMERQENVAQVTWQRNIVYNSSTGGKINMTLVYPAISGSGWMGSSDWGLSNVSYFNTESDMNV